MYQRIVIVGGAGTGKTTLATSLGKVLKLPVYHLDAINYEANWKPVGREKRDQIILEKSKEEKWIVDGNYCATLKQRAERADLVIFLNYSTLAHIKGVLTRLWKNRGKEKEELPGCKEKADKKFLLYVLQWNRKTKPKVEKAIQSVPKDKMLRFKNRKELNLWYEKEFHEKIKSEKGRK